MTEDQVMWPPVRAKLADDPDGLALLTLWKTSTG
jgi:hypothetical protein